MSVHVPENKRVVVGLIEDGGEVRAMTRRTGSCWRRVDVEDCDIGFIELNLERLNFDVKVGVEGDVDGGEGD